MSRPVLERQRWTRANLLLICLFGAHLLLKVLLLPRVLHAPLQGDERLYVDAARALSNAARDLLSLHSPDLQAIRTNVVGNGWFMPGMSLVLMPLFLLSPDAGPEATRVYLGVLTLVLFAVTVLVVRRTLGNAYAGALLVFPGLAPMWVLYSYSAWGDLAAGLVAIILLARLIHLAQLLAVGRAPRAREGLLFGFLCITILYLRSSTLPLVGALLTLVLIATVAMLRGRARRQALTSWGAAVAVFAALLLPWSFAASQSLGDRVVTTSTVPLSVAVAFGDVNELCFGPCDPGNIWYSMVRYSREVARASGVGELTVQKQMSDYALREVTARSYTRDVLSDAHRYVLQPSGYQRALAGGGTAPDVISQAVRWSTDLLYFGFLLVAAGGLLVVTRRRYSDQCVSILVKLMAAALMAQPFLHICTPRYWPVFAPLMAVSAVLVVQVARGRGISRTLVRSERVSTWLTSIQWVGATAWLLVVLAVALLSR